MLTKNEKNIYILVGLLTICLCTITLLPFEVLENRLNLHVFSENQILIKLVIFPIIMLLLTLILFVRKGKLIKNKKIGFKGVVKLSYFPIVAYIVSILGYAVGVIYSSGKLAMSINALVATMVFLVGGVVIYLMFTFASSWICKLKSKQMILFDLFVIISSAVILYSVFFCLNKTGSSQLRGVLVLAEICGYIVCLFISLITIVTSMYSSEKSALEDMKVSPEEKLSIEVTEEIEQEFINYYNNNKNTFIDKSKKITQTEEGEN